MYGKQFITQAHGKALSEFLTACMEAFLVVAYANGYDRWREEVLNPGNKESFPDFKFTSLPKGAKACEGWSNEGV